MINSNNLQEQFSGKCSDRINTAISRIELAPPNGATIHKVSQLLQGLKGNLGRLKSLGLLQANFSEVKQKDSELHDRIVKNLSEAKNS